MCNKVYCKNCIYFRTVESIRDKVKILLPCHKGQEWRERAIEAGDNICTHLMKCDKVKKDRYDRVKKYTQIFIKEPAIENSNNDCLNYKKATIIDRIKIFLDTRF